ncbi:hypothetical protein [Enterobacter roggenkampii]|uniref:hypothetical protein n=1 Tax=Enterobacter roggenkampii TaxID=1812935 RepID=UPI0013D74FFB|nr:hypothetical protein [Enterobacter roggenkampii]
MSNIDKQAQKELYAKVERQAHSLRGSPCEYQALTGLCPVNVIEMHAKKILALLDELEESERLRLKFQDANCELRQKLEVAERTSAARLGAIDTTHKMFQRERDRAEKAEKRIAELERKEQHSERQSVIDALASSGEEWSDIEEYMQKWDAERATAAGKGE